MKTMLKRFGQWLVMVSLALAGCARPVITQPPPTETIEPSPVPSATPTVEPTATMTQVITIKTPMPEPSSLETVTPPLTVREPSAIELNAYLEKVRPDLCYVLSASDMHYQDFSGDGEADLIVYSFNLVVMVWVADHYTEPFCLQAGWSRGGSPSADFTFEDWTGDGTPEIVVDYGRLGGGTGLFIGSTTRSIVHCAEKGCNLVWDAPISSDTDDYNTGGLAYYKLEMKSIIDSSGRPAIRTIDTGFSIYCCSEWGSQFTESLNVFTSTMSIYSWINSSFELSDEQIVSRGYRVDSQAGLTASGPSGVVAAVVARPNYSAGNTNEFCELSISDNVIGSRFGCRGNFTVVEWKDIIGDQQPEIVVVAYSAAYPYDDEGNELGDENCMHQHLIAYQWSGSVVTEIADVTGCVVRQDLYGVRLEDWDDDGQLEILAAEWVIQGQCTDVGCPVNLVDQIYKWNGSRFIFWDDVPSQ